MGLERLQSQVAAGGEIDFSRFGFSADDLERIPDGPGVYWMGDRGGTVFYVGKSKNLYRRIQSYILQSFLRQNLEVTNHIDVRQASGPEQSLEWIERYRKGETGGRTVFQR